MDALFHLAERFMDRFDQLIHGLMPQIKIALSLGFMLLEHAVGKLQEGFGTLPKSIGRERLKRLAQALFRLLNSLEAFIEAGLLMQEFGLLLRIAEAPFH